MLVENEQLLGNYLYRISWKFEISSFPPFIVYLKICLFVASYW
jgi:hypothetical protein